MLSQQPRRFLLVSRLRSTILNAIAVDNYLFQVQLLDIKDPCVTRVLSIPSNITFDKFHLVLQVAFRWKNEHTFTISQLVKKGESVRPPSLYTLPRNLAIEAQESGPFSVMKDHTIMAIQSDHEDADMVRYPVNLSDDMTLSKIHNAKRYQSKVQVMYEYGFGTGWEHQITYLGRANPGLVQYTRVCGLKRTAKVKLEEEARLACLSGQGHPVEEDCGGTYGWG